jgi:CelD/BcsL family acetyltransferase involved in cellulose biosynthesis
MSDPALTVRRWSLEEWMSSEASWSQLLRGSEADRLFMSWGWLTHWWRWFGGRPDCRPDILACYRGNSLVGVAPFYRRCVVRGRVVPARSVQLIGLSWRDPAPLISEYLDVIAQGDDVQAVRRACFGALLEGRHWTEAVIGSTATGRQWRDVFAEEFRARHYVREVDRSVSYQASLAEGFPAYLRALGQSTRRSLWNLRRRLAQQGRVALECVGRDEIAAGFTDLNRLHRLRWNKPAYAGRRLSFHLDLAERLAVDGELVFSRLRVGGEVVSVLYDVRKGDYQYNIKMGFDPSFSSRVSLGLIHLGYALESAAENRVRVYDFLAGRGKTSDYKHNLSQMRRYLSSVQMVRGRMLPRLYRWRDRAP